ncbi:hypothetical protein GCM10027445_53190 [Amycolatopsis endophytica]|uniref:hypothetical protein n=1 Tax=Amycolatopsis endophytica TaxID=860233 RepID=UPI0015C91EA4|nr:hypothetical protein [Amycolatopsis endophytica]
MDEPRPGASRSAAWPSRPRPAPDHRHDHGGGGTRRLAPGAPRHLLGRLRVRSGQPCPTLRPGDIDAFLRYEVVRGTSVYSEPNPGIDDTGGFDEAATDDVTEPMPGFTGSCE